MFVCKSTQLVNESVNGRTECFESIPELFLMFKQLLELSLPQAYCENSQSLPPPVYSLSSPPIYV